MMPIIVIDEISATGHLKATVTTPDGACHAFLCEADQAVLFAQRIRHALRETLDDYENARARAVTARQAVR